MIFKLDRIKKNIVLTTYAFEVEWYDIEEAEELLAELTTELTKLIKEAKDE